MGVFDFIFGTKKRQINEFLERGVIILDVRTQKEWENGHIKHAKHIPLDALKNRIEELKKVTQTCNYMLCQWRAIGTGSQYLNLNNIIATNGGGWLSLKNKVSSYILTEGKDF